MMQFIAITGPSGAGKTQALHSLEDAGYYTVDNLPPCLLPALIAYCRAEQRTRVAAVIDVRVGTGLSDLPACLEELRLQCCSVEVLFLDAGDDTLVHRFKESRRPHPLYVDPVGSVAEGGIVEAIRGERALLRVAREVADRVMDTSALTATQLRDLLHTTYAADSRPGLLVTVLSFGFKHGLPIDADLVFDVRFLVNPHYVGALQPRDGRDAAVADYVHADPLAQPFTVRMFDLIEFALPEYAREGKAYLNIAIGCTGGRHRSVVLGEDLAERLRADGYRVVLRHRDLPPTEGGK